MTKEIFETMYGFHAVKTNDELEAPIVIPTVLWLRENLTGTVELAVRVFALTSDPNAINVRAFMSAISDRSNDVLIVSDNDYALGIKSIYDAEQITKEHAVSLLALGNHKADNLV